ncbi:HNH endonuclease [Streptomyces sp. AK02-04a]|uniref:HNH endonuclease n=1 Tax=Streptomyces sp. AK02-04a TaxID=3028649 RepID=UPI0029B99E7D|nr:HNH endonuclease [Streptomyces sp. AK02-04a]MDX3757237.1 HNH endonuclease [Streptomyces sp. AK02-04a]
MSLHEKPHLNSKRRRNRKARLAARDGQRCTYCRRPFADLREATLDHVVPISLLWSWSADYLVLACRECNNAKANRLPLSIALLIAWSADPSRATVGPADWPLLARLAHAHQPTFAAVWTPDPIGHRSTSDLRDASRHTRRHGAGHHIPVRGVRLVCRAADRRPSIRPDCLRAPRPVRVCSRPTGEGVPA